MANVYNPSSLGIKAPSGGFQQGGWYEGRQYWGGTLSDPGVIHPSSNQVGAGQEVSREVVNQSDPLKGQATGTDWEYIQRQKQKQQQQNIVPSAYINPSGQLDYSKINDNISLPNFAPSGDQLNLPELYKNLMSGEDIKGKQAELDSLERQFTEAKAKINDNPYLSEATRVGRIAKLEQLHGDRTKNIRDELATKRADIETQLNLELKQFDINSQQAEQALQRFNTLLDSGALDNASGEDIATLTRATGIPSSMLYSAINANKKKNEKVELIKSEDDNGVVTVTAIDQNGNVVNQQSLGAIGNKQGSGGSSSQKINEVEVVNELIKDVRSGQGVSAVFRTYTGLLDPNQILSIYNANSPHGRAKESQSELEALGVQF